MTNITFFEFVGISTENGVLAKKFEELALDISPCLSVYLFISGNAILPLLSNGFAIWIWLLVKLNVFGASKSIVIVEESPNSWDLDCFIHKEFSIDELSWIAAGKLDECVVTVDRSLSCLIFAIILLLWKPGCGIKAETYSKSEEIYCASFNSSKN